MIRIVTGSAKNKKLSVPDIEGFRAVQEVAKSSLFSIIGERVGGAWCLDLYAGSGNLGIEALSRGAGWCDFVDENPLAVQTIEKNLFTCGFIDNYGIFRKNSLKYLTSSDKLYDLIFVDPFYSDTSHTYLLKNIPLSLKPDGIVGFFHARGWAMETALEGSNLKLSTQRKFGKSVLSVLAL